MITVNLRDERILENLKAVRALQEFGFSDAEVQQMYDSQFNKDCGAKTEDGPE